MSRVLGLDLGGTNIKWTVLELTGAGDPDVLARGSVSTDAPGGPEVVAARLVATGRAAMADHGPIAAAGIGIPGLFEGDDGRIVLFPNFPGPWPGFPLGARVATGLGLPVALINDARAFMLAEGTVGAGRGCRTVIGLTLGTGIGGGVMIDGRLHLGANGRAGEIGHQVVVVDGPPCGCGNRGCVEALARADRLAALAGRPTAADVYAGAAAGDSACLAAIAEVTGHLAHGLANVVTVLVPDRIVIGGGISAAGDLVLGPLRAAIRARVSLVDPDRIDVVGASLGAEAGAIGAALAASDLVATEPASPAPPA